MKAEGWRSAERAARAAAPVLIRKGLPSEALVLNRKAEAFARRAAELEGVELVHEGSVGSRTVDRP